MADRLFSASLHQMWQNAISNAANDVEQLDRRLFADPALGGHLRKISDKYEFEVARIDSKKIYAKRRETQREGPDGWGDMQTIKQTFLDVTIPFEGEADSFKISPSRGVIPGHHCAVQMDTLTLTIPDNDKAQGDVDMFVSQLNQNLDTLRSDFQKLKPQLEQEISQAAERRKQKINAENERDKKLAFPVQS
jgi:hypothetical protein